MLDGCPVSFDDQRQSFSYLQRNFDRFYRGNRAPLGVNMHAVWLRPRRRLAAMLQFLESILKLDDVYVISVNQLIEWMRSPRPLGELKRFAPWRTSCGGRRLARVLPPDVTTQSTLTAVTRRHVIRRKKKRRKDNRKDVNVASGYTVRKEGEGRETGSRLPVDARGMYHAGRQHPPFHPTAARNTTNARRRHLHRKNFRESSAAGGPTYDFVTSRRLFHCLVMLGGYALMTWSLSRSHRWFNRHRLSFVVGYV